MRKLYFKKAISINLFLLTCALGSSSRAVPDDIDTNNEYLMISRSGRMLCTKKLDTREFTEDPRWRVTQWWHGKEKQAGCFCFKFVREGAETYRIRDANCSRVLNVVHAFGANKNKDVEWRPNDGTWERHRSFRAIANEEGYYQFINEESNTVLGLTKNTRELMSFSRVRGDDQDPDKLFRIEREESDTRSSSADNPKNRIKVVVDVPDGALRRMVVGI